MNARERTRSHERQQTRKDRGRTAKAPGPLLRQKDTCPNSAAFLVRELVGIKDLMKNPDDKARSRQRVGQVEILPAWDFKKVKPQVRSGSTGEEGRWTSSFRIPHGPLSSATLRACEKLQQINGRVVLRGDSVKDDGGYRAALTEQGTSAL